MDEVLAQLPAMIWLPDVAALTERDLWRALSNAGPRDRGKHSGAAAMPLWVASGENPTQRPPIARRALRIRLAAPYGAPWMHGPRYGEVLERCLDAREEIIHVLLAIWTHWLASGKPKAQSVLGSFESWSEVIGGVLQGAGYDGFLQDLDVDQCGGDIHWTALFKLWWQYYKSKAITASKPTISSPTGWKSSGASTLANSTAFAVSGVPLMRPSKV